MHTNQIQPTVERVIIKTGVHKGVFTPAIFATISSVLFAGVISLPILFVLHLINQMTPTRTSYTSLFLFGVPMFLIYCLPALGSWFVCRQAYKHSLVTLTTKQLKLKVGFFERHESELLLSKIESVSLSQDRLGKKNGYGTVTVTGTGGTRFVLAYIPNPEQLRSKLNALIHGELPYPDKESSQAQTLPNPPAQAEERVCHGCGGWITIAEIQHCKTHPEKFGVKNLCSECQNSSTPLASE